MKDTQKYFENRNKALKKDPLRNSLARRELETLKILEKITKSNFLFKNSSVIDIGCGDKFLEDPFKEIDMLYYGYDIEDLDIELDQLPHKNDSLDLAISFALIEHLKAPQNMLNEIMRCLKPGGTLIISTPNWWYSSKNFFDDYTHVKPYSPNTLKHILKYNEFEEIYDFPNLRCKSPFSYTNRYRYFLANLRPFTSDPPFSKIIPGFLKGKAKGMFVVCKKPDNN